MESGQSISYGPFPVRLGRLLGAFAAVAISLLLCALALETQELRCDFGARDTCSLESTFSSKADGYFSGSDLTDVKVESVRRGKGKGTEYGVVVLVASRREYRLLDAEPDEARAIARSLLDAKANGTEFGISLKGSRWLVLFALVFSAVGASMAWGALRRMGALELSLFHDGSLRVARRVFGVRAAARSLSLYGVADVAIEWKSESDFWKGRYEVPRQVGRIVFATRDRTIPISDEFWPGRTLHFRAAAELRRRLGFSPGVIERELARLENTLERPAIAQTASQRFGLGWAGACVGALAGLALLGVLLLALGVVRMQDGIEPWMLAIGSGGGAVTGIALALHLARARPPR